MKKRTPTTPTRRVPRSVIAIAAPQATVQPTVERWKGGEIGWKVPHKTLEGAFAKARWAIEQAVGLEQYERDLRARLRQERAPKPEAEPEKEAGQ